MGFFSSNEEKIKEALQKIMIGDCLSFSTPSPFSEIDIWCKDIGYEMILRQTQIVGKTVENSAFQSTYSVNGEVIFLEDVLGKYHNLDEIMQEITKYRAQSSAYFSKNRAGWADTKGKCIYVTGKNILIPRESAQLCPVCKSPALVASARGKFFVSPPSPSGPLWSSGRYLLCFNCLHFEASYIKIGDPLEMICYECANFSKRAKMKLRKGKNGYFWGCENYPACKNTRNLYDWETNVVAPRPR